MKSKILGLSAGVAVAALTAAMGSANAEPVKIGMVTTLSGGGSGLGIDVRDGFQLAIDQEGGTLGGQEIELIVNDDAREPDRARQAADRMVERDEVDIMTGLIWSNLAIAVVPRVVREDVVYISANAGPSLLAGRNCHENYFNVAWQNDNLHEAAGQYVKDQGYDNVYMLAPNYPAGTDALEGFKRYYDGGIAGEVYTSLGQQDYAAELAELRNAEPDAVYIFLPGGMGISFIRQYEQSGLKETTPLFGPAFSFSQDILGAAGEAALGVKNASQWSKDLENPANAAFVEDFVAAYDRLPSLYASQGYDAARLIASALEATDGNADDRDALREALRAADFDSVRGDFRFGKNQHPIQDIYMREVVLEDGVVTNKVIGTAFKDHVDAYAAECRM